MADVAASANDPIFLNHHAMVDCIFETWLQKNPSAQYPISDEIPKGHRYDDYIVPFFPLYKHSDMFTTANNFGYQCRIDLEPGPVTEPGPVHTDKPWPEWATVFVGIAASLLLIAIIFCIILYYCRKRIKAFIVYLQCQKNMRSSDNQNYERFYVYGAPDTSIENFPLEDKKHTTT